MSEKTSTKTLAIFITNDTLTYLTKTAYEDEVFYSEALRVNLSLNNDADILTSVEKEIKANLSLLLYYDSVKICYLSTPINIVPTNYNTFNNENPLFLAQNKDISYHKLALKNVEASLFFNSYTPIAQVFKELPNLKNAHILHIGKLLIDEVKIDSEKNQVFVRLIEQNLEICIYKKGTFVFYNIFNVITNEDVVYYILNTLEQIKLDPTQTYLSLEGGISTEDLTYEYLSKYIQSVKINEEIEALGSKYLLYKIFECE